MRTMIALAISMGAAEAFNVGPMRAQPTQRAANVQMLDFLKQCKLEPALLLSR